MKNFALLLGIILCSSCLIFKKSENVVEIRTDQLLFKDDFLVLLDVWIIETPQKSDSVVFVKDNKLIINAEKGITIWLNKKLFANYVISFKRKVLVADGPYDRLSDMNVFWMATDPKNKDLFTRSGVFEEYDTLSLYYIGMGGNTNTTTRFRKYIDYGN